MNDKPITIDYFSDILCVWAWISQRRVDELNKHFENRIDIRYQFIDIFGDAKTRIEKQWADKGTYSGFGDHVIQSATPYESAVVNERVWHHTRPSTSANAHMVIKAVELAHDREIAADFCSALRCAFFIEAKDIGHLDTLYAIAEDHALNTNQIRYAIMCGEALAALMCDYQNAKDYGIKGSPCFVMNEGRQILFGNVGYRVLQTNIDELIHRTADEASWC